MKEKDASVKKIAKKEGRLRKEENKTSNIKWRKLTKSTKEKKGKTAMQ